MKRSPLLPVLSHALLLTISFAFASGAVMRADLTHVDSGRGFTKRELLHRMAVRSRARAASLLAACGAGAVRPFTAPVSSPGPDVDTKEYLIHFGISTRSQPVALTLDTGSDLIWTQCLPCYVCFDQPLPPFNASVSATAVQCSEPVCGNLTFSTCVGQNDACAYLYYYGDKSITVGKIMKDTFTFRPAHGKGGTIAVPGLSFGCALFNNGLFSSNETGIAGFGRGPLSLPSQLKIGQFSYCFTSAFGTKTSPVFLGAADNHRAHVTGPIRSTPFLQHPKTSPSLYYLSLKGITVGSTRLPISESAFALKPDGDGGTIIDSGTSFTTFPEDFYKVIHNAFVSQVKLPVVNSTAGSFLCFSTAAGQKVSVPRLVFHLEGADFDLHRDNYLMEDAETGMLCLLLLSSTDSMTLIGNLQQQNMYIVYDTANNKLSFAPAHCDEL